MALNIDTLGQALYNARQGFNDKSIDDLLSEYGDMNGVRLAMAKADAAAIINHFTANATVPALGLNAGAVAVTGSAKIQ